MSTASIEDLLNPNVAARALALRAQDHNVLAVYYRLGDFGDHQRVEVLVVIADEAKIDRDFRHFLEQGFAEVAHGPPFDFADLAPWPLLRVVRASESNELLEADPTWRTTTTS